MALLPMKSPSTTMSVDPPVIQTSLDVLPAMTSPAPATMPPTVSFDDPENDTPLLPFPGKSASESPTPMESPRISLSLSPDEQATPVPVLPEMMSPAPVLVPPTVL